MVCSCSMYCMCLKFNHNLLSIHKLAKDSKCDVLFQPNMYVITGTATRNVLGIGLLKQGLYYLQRDNKTLMESAIDVSTKGKACMATNEDNQFSLSHLRLGHASLSRMQHIDCVKPFLKDQNQVCLICPMSKMTKQPFLLSSSHAAKGFELLHTDIWGSYKVATRGKFRYFLNLVDDYNRMTWVYLLEKKSYCVSAACEDSIQGRFSKDQIRQCP